MANPEGSVTTSRADNLAQRRDCFPRLREGRLAALLAMTTASGRTTTRSRSNRAKQSQFREGGTEANSRSGKGLCESVRMMRLQKQSQFRPGASSFKLGVSSLHTPCEPAHHSDTPLLQHSIPSPLAEGRCAKQSQFRGDRMEANSGLGKGLCESVRMMRLEKQSQLSSRACSVPVRALKERVAGVSPALRRRPAFDTARPGWPRHKRLTASLRADESCKTKPISGGPNGG